MSIFRRLRTIGRYAWRGCKWLALIAIVGFVVYVVWTNHRGQAAAGRVLRELEARGVPDAQPKPDLPDEQNAARYYVAAGELLHVPPALAGQVPMVTNVRWPKFGEGMTEQQAAVLTEVINANATAFALLRQAEGDEPFRLDTDIDFHSRRAGANIGALRRIARWYTVDTLEAIATGDMNRAVDDCLAIFRVADVEVAYFDHCHGDVASWRHVEPNGVHGRPACAVHRGHAVAGASL